MAIINKSVTYLGALTTLTSITIVMVPGGYNVSANGIASDGAGNQEGISTSAFFPTGTVSLDNMAAAALQKLRIANGLEA